MKKEKPINDVCNSLKTRLIPADIEQPLNLSMRQKFVVVLLLLFVATTKISGEQQRTLKIFKKAQKKDLRESRKSLIISWYPGRDSNPHDR